MMNKKAATFYDLLIARIPKEITSNLIEDENAQDTFTLRNQELIMNVSFDESHLTFASMLFKHGKNIVLKGNCRLTRGRVIFCLLLLKNF